MNHIEAQANYYKNLHLRDRSIRAVIHIEDKDDTSFWNSQLQAASPGKYHFISHSRNKNGSDTRGCEQCLIFRPFLNNHFFICIDSDLRLLRGEKNLSAQFFIAQTHTYSWENHFCENGFLQQRFLESVNNSDFDFSVFLTRFSEIVYEPLLYLVHCNTPERDNLWNIRKFNRCIPLQPSREELAQNGSLYLQKVSHLFSEALSTLPDIPELPVNGLTPENAYLHIQGHQIYKLIRHIGTLICNGLKIPFTSRVLNSATQTSGYDEIDRVQSDLKAIISA